MAKMADLAKRMLFVLWAVPLGWWIINSTISVTPKAWTYIYPGQVLMLLLTFLGYYEYKKMLGIANPKNGFWVGYIWLALQAFFYFDNTNIPSNLGIYILLMLVALETFIWGKNSQQKRWMRASLLFSGTVFMYIAMISMLNFYKDPFQSLFVKNSIPMLSQLGICTVVTAVFFCDSGAYFVGNLWGKTHFSSISPKKTLEGSIGGFLSAVLLVGIVWLFIGNPAYPKGLGIILGILIGIFAQIGDLLVSLMKRYFSVKDASDIIPGHGGILDRFDSIFFAVPVVSLFAWLVNRIFGY
jgi:phosphatidate cytidylyltransferase